MLSRPRDERGAAAVVLAIMISLLVVVAAFAVDLGVQRVARRDMQALADVIALDMARQLDGRTQAVIKARADWRGGLEDSLERNLNGYGGSSPSIATQQQQADAIATVSGTPLVVTVRMGLLDPVTGAFTDTLPYPDVPNAVRVTTTTSVDFSFTPGSGSVTRTAIGQAEANACFSVGSFLVGLNDDPTSLVALLNPVLGDPTLTVASYQGLAGVDVTLLGLISASQIGVGSIDGLLALGSLSVSDIFLASAEALRNEGGTGNLAQADLLEHLASVAVVADVSVPVASLIDLTTAGDGALDVGLNVLELVAGAVTVANGTNFVGAPLNLTVPNLTSTAATVSVIEAAHLACGKSGARARTAQATVTASGTIGSTVAVPLGGTLTIGGPLSLAATLGQAIGTLGDVSCDPDVIPISVKTDAATLSQSLLLGITGNDVGLGSNVQGIPGLLTADISVKQSVSAGPLVKPAVTAVPLQWTIPTTDTYDTVKSTASGSTTLPHATAAAYTELVISDVRIGGVLLDSVRVLGIPLGSVVKNLVLGNVTTLVNALLGPTGLVGTTVAGLLSTSVNPLIDRLNVLVGSLAKVLGLDIAGADVGVRRFAKCNAPVLRG